MNGPRAAYAAQTVEWKDVWSSDAPPTQQVEAATQTEDEATAENDSRAAALRLREALIRNDLLITSIDRIARLNRRLKRQA